MNGLVGLKIVNLNPTLGIYTTHLLKFILRQGSPEFIEGLSTMVVSFKLLNLFRAHSLT